MCQWQPIVYGTFFNVVAYQTFYFSYICGQLETTVCTIFPMTLLNCSMNLRVLSCFHFVLFPNKYEVLEQQFLSVMMYASSLPYPLGEDLKLMATVHSNFDTLFMSAPSLHVFLNVILPPQFCSFGSWTLFELHLLRICILLLMQSRLNFIVLLLLILRFFNSFVMWVILSIVCNYVNILVI